MSNIDIDVVTEIASRQASAVTRALVVNFWIAHDDEKSIQKWRQDFFKSFLEYLSQDALDVSLRSTALASSVDMVLGYLEISKTISPNSTKEKDVGLLNFCKAQLNPKTIVRSAEKIKTDLKKVSQNVLSSPSPTSPKMS